ncbi:MAG: hypothetical protein GEV03_11500 [Streptosporangiales bacterium]|nr:hypothetical protein [Streptosporangiales bacterium]
MIVRIMEEGQFRVDDSEVDDLNALDDGLQQALDSGDHARFREALDGLLHHVRAAGESLPPDALEPSDLILPPADADINEVRAMLTDEGLIPG